MKKAMLGIGIVVFAVIALAMPAAAQEVYLVPADSNADFCNTVDVEIRVDATNFQSGQIRLEYDSTCADVTNFVRNTADFPMGGWDSSVDGREWITFMGITPLTGDYLIGTLTIHCVSQNNDSFTALDFVAPSALFDPLGNEIAGSTWTDGTFTGNKVIPVPDTVPPYTAGHNPAKGAVNIPVDTNIVVHVLDDDSGVNRWSIVMTVEGAQVVPVITGTTADYTLTYNPPVDFDEGQQVDVTVDASDLAALPNVMPTDAYWFRIFGAPAAAVPLLGPPAIIALAAVMGILAITVIARNKKKGMK